MNLTLWIFQAVLAAVFAGSGLAKITMSRERLLATGQTGITPFPMAVVRATAAAELLAVAGLLLPWATGIASVLTPTAAIGLCVVMVGAAASHAQLREPRNVAVNALLFALALTVAAGRLATPS
jgi:uncharacterized membrane protein YphA (DoxX/SURF4 family)